MMLWFSESSLGNHKKILTSLEVSVYSDKILKRV